MFASAFNDIARASRRDRAALWVTTLAVCAIASCSGHGCGGSPPPSRPAPPEVSVLTLRAMPVTVYDEYVARVAAPDTIEIRSQVTGTLERVEYVEGAFVERGALLYLIERSPFEAAVRQAEADLAQARTQAVNARANEARYRELFERRVVSAQEYENYATAARALVAQADSREAALRNARINLDYTEIRAPESGSVSRSLVQPGALITAQQTLLTTLFAGDVLYVYFAVDQDDVPYLTRPSSASVATSKPGELSSASPEHTYEIVLGDGTALPTRGHLDFLAPAIEGTTGTMQARLQVPIAGNRLLPGQYVRVRVPIVERSAGIRVPLRAVSELQGLKSVFVVGDDGKVRSRRIEAEHRVGEDWLVDRGLSAGDTIVVEGTGKVHDGQAVRTVPFTSAESE